MAVARLAIVWMPAVMREDRETVWTQARDASGSRADVRGEELRVLSMVSAAEQTRWSNTSGTASLGVGRARARHWWEAQLAASVPTSDDDRGLRVGQTAIERAEDVASRSVVSAVVNA